MKSEFYVWVQGWDGRYFVRVEGNQIDFEVTHISGFCMSHVSHSQVHGVTSVLDGRSVPGCKWSLAPFCGRVKGSYHFGNVLTLKLEEMPENVLTYLSGLLHLELTKIEDGK